MKIRRYLLIILTLAYGVLWIGGISSYIFLKNPPPEASWAAPAFLFLAGLIILASSNLKQSIALLMAGFIGFTSEIIGVHTGFPFGNYQYTLNFKPEFLDVPVVMTIAWIVLVAYVRQFTCGLFCNRVLYILISALMMVWLDLLIDPVAIGPMKLWVWHESGFYYGIPTLNFLGWFIVSIVIFILIGQTDSPILWHRYIGLSLVLFFTIIAFAEKLFVAGIAGSALLILQIATEYYQKKQNL